MSNENPTVKPFSAEHLIEDIRLIGNYDIAGLRDEMKGWEDSSNSQWAHGNEQGARYARSMMAAIAELIALRLAKEKEAKAKEEQNLAEYRLGEVIGKYINRLMAKGE